MKPGARVCARHAGFDFLAFYTAGTFVGEGRTDALYDLEAVRAFQRETAATVGLELAPDAVGPWWNPPFYAWVFVPLAGLGFPAALWVWTALNLAAVAGAAILLAQMLCDGAGNTAGSGRWGLVPLLIVASAPFALLVTHGQSTGTSLLLLTLTVAAWRSRQAVLAGAVLGLLCYKPQLAVILAAVLVLDLGWRALAGLAVAGGALLGVTLWTLPGTLTDYLHRLPANLRYMQVDHAYLWDRHATLKAFWRLLLQGLGAGEVSGAVTLLWLLSGAAVATALAAVWIRCRAARTTSADARDRLIAITIAATPLLMPFYFDYDLLLLAVPAVLVAARWSAGDDQSIGRWGIGAWVGLYLWLFLAPFLAGPMRLNLTVPLLAAIVITMARGAWATASALTSSPESNASGPTAVAPPRAAAA